jgi:hypothetical protein
MTARPAIPILASACLLVLAACSGSTDSQMALPEAETTTAPDSSETPASSEPAAPVTEEPAVDPGETAPPATDTASPPTDPPATAATVPATDPPAPVPSAPSAATTVVYAGNDFGGAWPALATWDGSAWQEADFDAEGIELTPPESAFAAVSVASLGLDAPLTGLAYGADDFVCVDDRMGPTLDLPVTVGEIAASMGYNSVAVATDWDIQPRAVQQVGLDVVEYQAIGESITAAAGIDGSGGDVVQAIRADLDGNSVEEVLVTFEKITEGGFGTPGDFSIVFARYPAAAGGVVDDVLFEHYPGPATDFPTMGSGGVIAVADLNGDAVMEVVLRGSFWESSIVEMYSFTGGSLVSVATTGCGL